MYFLPAVLLATLIGKAGQPTLAARTPAPAADVTHIGTIQGTGPAATPGTYTIEAIVTGVYAGLNPAGFYVQEAADATDGNPATADALYVVQPSATVRVGDKVRVTGTVQEASAAPSFDQAVLIEPTVTVLASNSELPAFTTLASPFTDAALERYEGMRVQFATPLTVAEVYSLKQRGELQLATGGPLYQPTQFVDPNDNPATGNHSTGSSNLPAIKAYEAANTARSIILDDGSAATNPKPTPYLDPRLGTMRVGSTIAQLRGVLGYGFGKWRVQPLPGAEAPVFNVVRPAVPSFGALDVKLASFNVLNYFNGDGLGGGFPTPRGAKTAADFTRQRAKIIAALVRMNADVVGLMEVENDGSGPNSAIQDLVNGLNKAAGAGTYAFVNDGGASQQPNNTDAIRCAIIYKPAAVALLGPARVAAVTGVFERPPLAQIFTTRRNARPDTLALVVNHFKSKASGKDINADQNDGQGGSNDRRRVEAHALVQFLHDTVYPAGTSRVICIGDYNANYEEDPIDILREDRLVTVTPPTSASFVFKGLTGSLDHCIVTPNMVGFIDVQKWHINSFEPGFLEYDQAGEATDMTSPFRSSDHDPVLIGVRFLGIANASTGTEASRLLVYPNPAAGSAVFRLASVVPTRTKQLAMEFYLLQGKPLLRVTGSVATLQAELGRYTAHLPPGIYLLRLQGRGFSKTQRVMKE
jgi:predicted extracellular nuclease